MKLLAIEMSTSAGSLALFESEQLQQGWNWTEERRQNRRMFDSLAEVPGLDGVDVFAVGIGPGNYTGLRTAVTAAQSLALPGEKASVYCVPSGDALVAEEAPDGSAVVIGDARRGLLWTGWFESGTRSEAWALCTWDELAVRVEATTRIFSPDADRIREQYPVASLPAAWPEEVATPTAEMVGALALQRLQAGIESEAASPLYLQPPV